MCAFGRGEILSQEAVQRDMGAGPLIQLLKKNQLQTAIHVEGVISVSLMVPRFDFKWQTKVHRKANSDTNVVFLDFWIFSQIVLKTITEK